MKVTVSLHVEMYQAYVLPQMKVTVRKSVEICSQKWCFWIDLGEMSSLDMLIFQNIEYFWRKSNFTLGQALTNIIWKNSVN